MLTTPRCRNTGRCKDVSEHGSLLVEPPQSDENDEYLSVVWGILRRPIACTKCGLPTRTPSYWSGDQPSPPICGACFRLSVWGH